MRGPLGRLASTAFAAASKDEVRRFDDWFVACDNGLACAAGSLVPDGDSNATTVFSLHRAAAATAEPEFEILVPEGTTVPDRYEVDGKPVSLHPKRKDDWLQFPPEDVPALVSAMRRGALLALVDEDGQPIATASMAGATAAMLAIDEAQNRLGTTTALVRRGAKSPDTIPPPPPLPEVDAIRTSRKPVRRCRPPRLRRCGPTPNATGRKTAFRNSRSMPNTASC